MNPKKLILILEDDIDARSIYETLLEEEGYECAAFETSNEVMHYMKKEDRIPFAFLTDLNFPGMSLPELITSFGDIKIPTIVISGRLTVEEDSQAIGAEFFLAKPFNLTSLLDMLGEIK